jgi:ArsR family transcriptional regulator
METRLPLIQCCTPLASETLDEGEAEATAELFKALADPARVRIVNRLAQSDEAVCACEFPQFLRLSQPTASHHLSKLTRAGLLNREQRGKWAYFSLDPEAAERLAGVVRLQEVVS